MKKGFLISLLLIITLTSGCPGSGPSSVFLITNVDVGATDGLPSELTPDDVDGKILFTLRFNHQPNRDTLLAPGTVDVVFSSTGNCTGEFSGTFYSLNDPQKVLFVSDSTRSDVVGHCFVGDYSYTITVEGVRDTNGLVLDGDYDSEPGGEFVKSFSFIG